MLPSADKNPLFVPPPLSGDIKGKAEQEKEKKEIETKVDKSIDENFDKLSTSYQNMITNILKTKEFQANYKEKVLFHIFLDKLSKNNVPEKDVEDLSRYQYSASSVAHAELLKTYKFARGSNLLTPQAKKILDSVIKQIEQSLPLAFIYDGIRAKIPELMAFIQSPPDLTLELVLALEEACKRRVNEKEVFAIVDKITQDIKNLKPLEHYHCLSGTFTHDTQIMVQKEQDGSYSLYYYDSKAQESPTVVKFGKISASDICNPNFWKQIVMDKLTSYSSEEQKKVIRSIGTPDPNIDKLAIRRLQVAHVCTYASIQTMLRHQMVAEYSTPEEGAEQFRICQSLVKSHAIANASNADPLVLKYAKRNEEISRRYIVWQEEIGKGNFEKLKQEFIKMILSDASKDDLEKEQQAIEKSIAGKTPLQALNYLHRRFMAHLKKIDASTSSELLKLLSQPSTKLLELLTSTAASPWLHCLKPSYLAYQATLRSNTASVISAVIGVWQKRQNAEPQRF